MKQPARGFTIIELIVVIVIIGILTTFITIQLAHSQLAARDEVRKNDASIIASTLEGVYQSGQLDGNIVPTGDGSLLNAVPMAYPSTALITTPNDSQSQAIVGTIDPNVLKSPLKKTFSLVAATSNAGTSGSTAGGITLGASSAGDVYVYQPLDINGTLCQFATGNVTLGTGGVATQVVIAPRLKDNCVKFVIYYYSEASSSIKSLASLNSGLNGL